MTTISHPGIGSDVARPRLGALIGRMLRGRTDEAAWVRPAHVGVSLLAAALYLVNLTVSGFANTYYSAAALAASKSWSAWFFGSFDAANFITIDKPPLATMLMGLSVRLFGLNSWSILLPEALAGVATVALLFVIVRRSFGPVAAVIAALVMALTPAAVLMFRYNNPDALLTLLLVLAAWAFLRALESGSTRWVVAAAVFVGLAFNTKYLQAYLVLPAFAITYALAAPGSVRRRLAGLVVAAATVLLSSGWWVLAVELLPASARPYIGGSATNSALQLLLGYDGLGRIFGAGGGAGGGPGGGGGGFSGAAGLLRLFNAQLGGQVSWLIPFSFAGLAAGLWQRRRTPRMDRARAGYVMWGLWLVVHALVFSFMSGIIHSYYAVAMAPAIGALVGAGAVDLWALRTRARFGGLALGLTILVSAAWAWQLLERTPEFAPGLGLAVLIVGAVVAAIVAMPPTMRARRTQLAAAGLGVVVLLGGPAAYALDTMATAYAGGDPKAGPATSDGGPGGATVGRAGLVGPTAGGPVPSAAGGGIGAPDGGGRTADPALIAYLLANRNGATWIVATTSANEAGSIQLASGEPVVAMGGFSGSDPAPSLAQLQALVASGELRYVLIGGGGPGAGGPAGGGRAGGGPAGGGRAGSTSEITAWVTSVGTAVDFGGSGGTLYDMSGTAATGA
jgi:4-amino-4-deoxy-L-arabinose transferase-like glycosyltransferase